MYAVGTLCDWMLKEDMVEGCCYSMCIKQIYYEAPALDICTVGLNGMLMLPFQSTLHGWELLEVWSSGCSSLSRGNLQIPVAASASIPPTFLLRELQGIMLSNKRPSNRASGDNDIAQV